VFSIYDTTGNKGQRLKSKSIRGTLLTLLKLDLPGLRLFSISLCNCDLFRLLKDILKEWLHLRLVDISHCDLFTDTEERAIIYLFGPKSR
jgi:hypothetical protein